MADPFFDPSSGQYIDFNTAGIQQSPDAQSPPPPQQTASPPAFSMEQVLGSISDIASSISEMPDRKSLTQLQESQLDPGQIDAKKNYVNNYIQQALIGKEQTQFWDSAIGVHNPKVDMDWIDAALKMSKDAGIPNIFEPNAVGEQLPIPGQIDLSTSEGRNKSRAQDYATALLGEGHQDLQTKRATEDFLLGDDFIDQIEEIRNQQGDEEAESYYKLGDLMLNAVQKGVKLTPDDVQSVLQERQQFMDKYDPMKFNPITGRTGRSGKIDYSSMYAKRLAAHLSILGIRQQEDQAAGKQAIIMGMNFEGMPDLAHYSPTLAEQFVFKNLLPSAKTKSSQQQAGDLELQAIQKMGGDQYDMQQKDQLGTMQAKVKTEDTMINHLLGGSGTKQIIGNALGVPNAGSPYASDTTQEQTQPEGEQV